MCGFKHGSTHITGRLLTMSYLQRLLMFLERGSRLWAAFFLLCSYPSFYFIYFVCFIHLTLFTVLSPSVFSSNVSCGRGSCLWCDKGRASCDCSGWVARGLCTLVWSPPVYLGQGGLSSSAPCCHGPWLLSVWRAPKDFWIWVDLIWCVGGSWTTHTEGIQSRTRTSMIPHCFMTLGSTVRGRSHLSIV